MCLALAACGSTQLSPSLSIFGGGAPSKVLVGNILVLPNLVVTDSKTKLKRDAAEAARSEQAAAISGVIGETVAARLKAAGLEAARGATDIAAADTATLVVTGRVRSAEQADRAKRKFVGFGRGKNVAFADVNLSLANPEGRKAVISFTAEADIGRPTAARPAPAENPGGLPPEAEALARRLGDVIADRIIEHAVAQGWIKKPA